MPMDIRNFFGKAAPSTGAKKPDSKSKLPKPASNAISKVAAITKKSAAASRPAAAKEAAASKTKEKRRTSTSTATAAKSKAAVAPEKKPTAPTKPTGVAKKQQQQQAISVDTDNDDDDDEEEAEEAPAKQQPPPKKEASHQKKRRVIIDDSDEDDVVGKPKSPAKKAKTPPAKKAKTPSPTKSNSKPKETTPAASQPNRLSSRRTSSGKAQQDAATLQSQEPREEVSVEDFFGGSNRTRAEKRETKEEATKSDKKVKKDRVVHDDDDGDDDDENYVDAGHDDEDGDDDEEDNDFVNDDEEDEDEEDAIDVDDDDEDDYGKKAKSKKVQSKSSTLRQTTTKRKVEPKHDEDDDDEDEKPPPRKSPRKQSSASPKSSNDASSSKPATKTPTRKQPTKAAATKPVPLKPLDPGLQLDSFDLDAVVASECLAGTTFVFSGIMPELNREEAQELVKMLGGRVTGSVSNKTTYLVLGHVLEDGRAVAEGKKYQFAKEKGVRLVQGEKELYGLAKLYHDRAVEQQGIDTPKPTSPAASKGSSAAAKPVVSGNASTKASSASGTDKAQVTSNGNEQQNLKQPPVTAPITNVYAKKPPPSAGAVINPYAKKVANPYASQKPKATSGSASQASAAATTPSSDSDATNRLWADKYAPQVSQEVLGNKDMVDKLAKWLQRWEASFSGNTKVKTSDSGPKKAALLSGPPGIGKTTTANLVAKEAGRDILEFNASDVRSKKALQNDLGDVTGSQSINFAAPSKNGKPQPATRRRVLIMDEVDGMGAGDRNGMAELIKMIKASRVPIICICNDRQSQKIRSLVPYCLDLRFRRPSKSVIANRAIKVASMEGLQVERNAAEAIAESCGNDVRQVLNCLQMWASQGNQERMTYKDLKDRENFINKDDILRVNIFDATKMIVEGRRGLNDADKRAQVDSFYKRNDAFFVDYSLMGLNVHQNYMKVMMAPFNEVKRTEDPDKLIDFLDRMHDAAHAMSDFALVEKEIRGGDMNWSLLPFSGVMAVKTGFHAGGENGSFFPGFPDFPAWMGKNSTRGKKSRILQELSYHMNYKVSGGRTALRLSYVPTLRERLYSMIANADESDTTNAIHLMDEYGLDRDDVFEKLDEFKIDSKVDFGKIEGKAKAAFTREYNNASHKSQALVAEQGGAGSKRKRGGAATGEKDPADLDAIDEDGPAEAEESDGDAEDEDFEKIKKIFGKKGRKSGGQATARGSKAAGAKASGGKAAGAKASGGKAAGGKAASARQNKRSKK